MNENAPKVETERERRSGFFAKVRRGLFMTHTEILEKLGSAVKKGLGLDESALESLEEALIDADVGAETAEVLTGAVRSRTAAGERTDLADLRRLLIEEIEKLIAAAPKPAAEAAAPLEVIFLVGVNGSGKTTTIGKLAAKFSGQGRKVMLAAGDTFRAAAIEQLKVWGERTRSPVIAGAQGSDSASLAFNALTAAKEQNIDVLLVDTAGRLQNKAELMNELEKVVRVIKKVDASAPHAVLLVLDATVGQNALSQVEAFHRTAGVTGLVMTKLDGTARGGILVALSEKYKLPVHFIGVGEGIDDLAPFTARDFAQAIAGIES